MAESCTYIFKSRVRKYKTSRPAWKLLSTISLHLSLFRPSLMCHSVICPPLTRPSPSHSVVAYMQDPRIHPRKLVTFTELTTAICELVAGVTVPTCSSHPVILILHRRNSLSLNSSFALLKFTSQRPLWHPVVNIRQFWHHLKSPGIHVSSRLYSVMT